MHMADALISPAVGGTMWAASASAVAWSCRRVKAEPSDKRVPLMGVMAAFAFAVQMINFAIPGTGSSGHLGGGVLLAVILGPHAALLTIVSVLTVQAVFFADGGLLALGCNVFNLGVIPCLAAYPLIFRRLSPSGHNRKRLALATFVTAVFALQLGAFAVVLQTFFSGVSELPLGTFALLMQPIHLVVGLIEGAATFAVIGFVAKARPELLHFTSTDAHARPMKRSVAAFAVSALLIGGGLSWLASANPDGLEWAVEHTAGPEFGQKFEGEAAHRRAADIQAQTALMPGYEFQSAPDKEASQFALSAGTSAAGVTGGIITLLLAGLVAWVLSRKRSVENT